MDKEIQEQLYDPRKGRPKKGVVPPQLRPYLFKKGRHHDPAPRKKAKFARLREEMTKTERVLTPQFIRGKYTEQKRFDPKRMPWGAFYEGKLQQTFRTPEAAWEYVRAWRNDPNYDPSKATVAEMAYDPRQKLRAKIRAKLHSIGRPPTRWFEAMKKGIAKGSDVRDPAAVVTALWRRLSPVKRAEIKAREAAGKSFRYDLPLPQDATHKGGIIRVVKPFKLAEAQLDVTDKTYKDLERTGIFKPMRRQDGSTALVVRSKSPQGNANIFVDRRR